MFKRFISTIIVILMSFFFILNITQANDHIAQENSLKWSEIVEKAKGKTIYFYAWGGSQEVNDYIKWADQQLQKKYNIHLKQVKITNISETIQRILAEKVAGNNTDGSVGMIWINGENFWSMKNNGLLYGPFVKLLPNWQYVDKSLPVDQDFTLPTDGYEAPWGVGQLVFIYDTETLKNPPKNFKELLTLAQQNPNKITYPKPPEFHGSSFLKVALLELTPDKSILYQPLNLPQDQEKFKKATAPLWHYLDQLHQVAWQQGKKFPASSAEMFQLLDDHQLLLAITFNPNAAQTAILNGNLPETAKTYAFTQGALTNIHFLAIPWNSPTKESALVAINFLMSPEAQARKIDSHYWGDPTILTPQAISKVAPKIKSVLFKSIPEPHPSWLTAIEQEWQKRYNK